MNYKLINISECHTKCSPLLRYPFAVGIAIIATLFRFLVLPLEAGLAFLTFYPAIVISFYLCGIRPGIVTALLSTTTAYYFFKPPYVAVMIFLFSAYLIGFVVQQMQNYAEQFRLMLAALQQNVLSHQSFLNDQTEIICRFKADGTILYVNDAFCRLFGKQRENLIGHKWHPVVWSEDIPLINEKLNTLSPENPVVTIENRIITADGSIRWGQFVNRAFFDNEGQLIEMQGVGRDITEKKQYEEQIAQIAYHDILTGLPNRLLVSDRLNQALAQAERSEQLLVVCYLDLDGFKPINDKFGHHAGDRLLMEITKRMVESIRIHDTVGRLGGDEFVILLTDIDNIEEYQIILQRVLDAINEPVILDEFDPIKVGASIGITIFPSDNSSPDTLLRHADQAMYQAKKLGRNRINIFAPEDVAKY